MRVLLALGGNAMTNADGRARPEDQIAAAETAMAAVADLLRHDHEVVITHGNGPQVGNLLVKNELAATVVPPVPLDWCGAQTQATLGFVLMDALEAALARGGTQRRTAALVTRALVDADDEGFRRPTKPIGRYLNAEEAQVLIDHGQTWEDRGDRGWRRVVASPEPLEILDAPAVLALIDRGPQGPAPLRLRRLRAGQAHRRGGDRGRPGHRDHRQDRGQRRGQRLHPDHRRPRVPRGPVAKGADPAAVKGVPIVWSGGTDGVISPHATIFATVPADKAEQTDEPRLTVGFAMSEHLLPEEIGYTRWSRRSRPP
jgi:hypothetical protein